MRTSKHKQVCLEDWEGNWQTDLGGWFPGERALFRGRDLFKDLKETSWMALLLYGITGREFTQQQISLFEGMFKISTSYPDPRIWNNRIAALAGTARSTVSLGLSAGTAASEAIIFGHRVLIASMDFLQKTLIRLEKKESLNSILDAYLKANTEGRPGSGKNRQVAKIPGFGRPLTARDERLIPLLSLAAKWGFNNNSYIKMAKDIENTLINMGHPLHMNVATLMAALCADQGLSPREYYHFCLLAFNICLTLCAIDAQQKPEGAFFPIRCQTINYQGKALRYWVSPKN